MKGACSQERCCQMGSATGAFIPVGLSKHNALSGVKLLFELGKKQRLWGCFS